jgi:serine/threonine-protein kinase
MMPDPQPQTARIKLTSQSRIGNYQIIRELGRGGMGTVYLAERSDEYQMRVAIKVIRDGPADELLLQRFLSERQILANLEHPNIARLIDGGHTESGLPFLVMEYIEGVPIEEYCETHKCGLNERLELFQQVCNAVAYAHRHLVVHRDLKPSNILVTEEGSAKLLDFGIAKLLEPDLKQAEITATVARVMTPQYASPEQAQGTVITTSSDIYSLGVLLYKLLTCQNPYQFSVLTQREIERVITQVEPERPSRTFAQGKASEVKPAVIDPKLLRGDLDNIILMALRKDPQRRYQSAEQFSEDLRRHLHGLPVRARKDTISYRCSKFLGRHRYGAAAAALILISLIAGVVATIRQSRLAQRERAKAIAVNSFLQTMLSASSPAATSANDRDLTMKEVLDEASKRLATDELSSEPDVKAELQRIVGTSYLARGEYKSAEQHLTAALAAESDLYGVDSVDVLKTLVQLGTLWMSIGDYAKADNFYEQRLPLLREYQKKGLIESEFLQASLSNSALRRRALGDPKQAASLLREALALPDEASPGPGFSRVVAETVLALTLADQGEFDEAIDIVKEKLNALKDKPDGDSELCVGLTGLGSFLMERGDLAEAQQKLREGEKLYRKISGQSTIQLGDNLRLQAQTAYELRDYAEAEAKINQTWAIYRDATKPQYLSYATALTIQGLIYSQTGRVAEAEKLLREAYRLRLENMPESHFLRALTSGALGEFLVTQKKFGEAEPLLLASYESFKKSQSPKSPRIKLASARLVNLYTAWGKNAEVEKYKAGL